MPSGGAVASANFDIFIAGKESEDNDLQSCIVDQDIFQPDMAAVLLSNQGDKYSATSIGDTLEVKVKGNDSVIFEGEVVGLEPVYRGGGKTTILVRGMNKLHRLLRKRESMTFTDKSDQQILSQVVKSAGLSLEWKHDKSITYKHVYQHNQTDLEFLRTRAARMGCHVWCVGNKVFVKQPDMTGAPVAKIDVDDTGKGGPDMAQLLRLAPRLNSSSIVKKVTVKGWNPETKELIVGNATVKGSKLGSQNAAAAASKLAEQETFTVDHPIWSVEEAKALAEARLQDLSLSYITGEAEVAGNPKFALGKLVQVKANAMKADDPFNGKYYIMGVTHRHILAKAKDQGGYTTIARFARDAQKE